MKRSAKRKRHYSSEFNRRTQRKRCLIRYAQRFIKQCITQAEEYRLEMVE